MYEIVFAIIFSLLLAVNFKREQSFLAPATLLSFTWLMGYLCLIVGGNFFNPLELEVNIIYFLGALSFSISCILGKINFRLPHVMGISFADSNQIATLKILRFLLAITLLFLPYYLYLYYTQVAAREMFTYLAEARNFDVDRISKGPNSFSIVNNFSNIALFVCMTTFYMNEGFKKRKMDTIISIVVALTYSMASGTKQLVIILPLTLLFLNSIRKGHFRIINLLLTVLLAAPVFIAMMYLVNFHYINYDFPVFISELLRTFYGYWAGGMVSFQNVVQDPTIFENNATIWRFFLETSKSLGFDVQIPPFIPRFSFYSNNFDTNIYTIYFGFFMDYGLIGVIVLMSVLGFFLSWAYQQACNGNILFTFLYARFCVGILMSLNSDKFFYGLNSYLKQIVFLLAVYHLPVLLNRVSQRKKDVVHA